MAVIVDKEQCIGCSACVGACPFGAIVMEDDKAVITDACTVCGACIDVCPVTAITRPAAAEPAADTGDYQGVWVYIEQFQGKVRNVGLELLGEGRKLAGAMGQELAAVVIGEGVEPLARELFASGADKVYLL